MKTINVIMLALVAPIVASAQYEPASQLQNNGPAMQTITQANPNLVAYQSGIVVDSGAGILVIGILIYFLFFKKKSGN